MTQRIQDLQRRHGVGAAEAMRMQAAQRTQGPWVCENVPDLDGGLGVFNVSGASYKIATVHLRHEAGEREANASLVAAAPDLLEAAKAMLRTMEKPNPTHTNTYRKQYDQWRFAIRKAESR